MWFTGRIVCDVASKILCHPPYTDTDALTEEAKDLRYPQTKRAIVRYTQRNVFVAV